MVVYSVEVLPDEYPCYTVTRLNRKKNTRVLASIYVYFGRVPGYPSNNRVPGYPAHYYHHVWPLTLQRMDSKGCSTAFGITSLWYNGFHTTYHQNDRLRAAKASYDYIYIIPWYIYGFAGSKHMRVSHSIIKDKGNINSRRALDPLLRSLMYS